MVKNSELIAILLTLPMDATVCISDWSEGYAPNTEIRQKDIAHHETNRCRLIGERESQTVSNVIVLGSDI